MHLTQIVHFDLLVFIPDNREITFETVEYNIKIQTVRLQASNSDLHHK